MTSIWFEGIEDLTRLAVELPAAGLRAGRLAQLAVAKTAADIEATGKTLAPVDTGNLKNSIFATVGTLTAEIGPSASYGAYPEYGTSRMPPQPYMTPAFDRHTPAFIEAMGLLGGQVLEAT